VTPTTDLRDQRHAKLVVNKEPNDKFFDSQSSFMLASCDEHPNSCDAPEFFWLVLPIRNRDYLLL